MRKDLVSELSTSTEPPIHSTDGKFERIATHLDALHREAQELKEEFPDFDIAEALQDKAFLRLTAPGVGIPVRQAYYALHRDELDKRAESRGASAAKALIAKSIASGGTRVREGGGKQQGSLHAADYRAMSRKEQQQFKRRITDAASRGEKLYP